MLCKQWQMGEFAGDDAGSPVSAKIHVTGQQIAKYEPLDKPTQDFDLATPLETTVERRRISFAAGKIPLALDLRLQMGRRWLQMIPASARDAVPPALQDRRCPIPRPSDDAAICAHPQALQQFRAVAGRAMDGGGALSTFEGAAHEPRVRRRRRALGGRRERPPMRPGPPSSTGSTRCIRRRPRKRAMPGSRRASNTRSHAPRADGAGNEKVLAADEYFHGRLDWYNFDWDKSREQLGDTPAPIEGLPMDAQYSTRTFIPAPVRFNGMPDTRWWAFEDGKTNFGDIKPGTTDLAKLLLIEFGLVYANDWFLLPHTVPDAAPRSTSRASPSPTTSASASGSRPRAAAATRPGSAGISSASTSRGERDEPADLTLLMLPTVPKIQDGAPLEGVRARRATRWRTWCGASRR